MRFPGDGSQVLNLRFTYVSDTPLNTYPKDSFIYTVCLEPLLTMCCHMRSGVESSCDVIVSPHQFQLLEHFRFQASRKILLITIPIHCDISRNSSPSRAFVVP